MIIFYPRARHCFVLVATSDISQEGRKAGGVLRTPPAFLPSWAKRHRR